MSELTDILRNIEHDYETNINHLCEDAADEIERLTAEVTSLRTTLKAIKDQAEIEGAYKPDSAFPYIAGLAGDALASASDRRERQK